VIFQLAKLVSAANAKRFGVTSGHENFPFVFRNVTQDVVEKSRSPNPVTSVHCGKGAPVLGFVRPTETNRVRETHGNYSGCFHWNSKAQE